MIIKGGSRGGPGQLAAHLQRTDTNERVEVLELHAGTDDLAATLRDWQVLSEATRGTKGLYHANIDPDARYDMTAAQWMRAVDVLEKELGLTGQPRAVVMHEKKGRQHIHVVWQRTDLETMTLREDGFNYLAHERASQRMEREFGHESVPGKHAKRDREKQPEFPRAEISHAEWQQAERAALSVADRRAQLADIRESCDGGTAFRAAVGDAGYVLAQGDRRDFVLVTAEGSVLSLGRELKMKAAEVRAFMADVDLAVLPAAAEARAAQKARQEAPAPDSVPDIPPPAEKPIVPEQAPDLPEDLAPAPEAQKPALDPAALDPVVARALDERQRREAAKLAEWHAAEARQLDHVLSLEMQEKLDHQAALHAAAQDRLRREQQTTGIDRFMDALQNRLNPGRGAEAAAARKDAWRHLRARQAQEARDMERLLEQTRAEQMDELRERHAQQQREQAAAFEAERQRYAQDTQRAAALRARIEEERRLQEEVRQQGRGADGPPGRTK
ncbi:relaxase/mobilization nuclease domain-containing protein [Salipiger marinus]|uniref:Relaxase/Mobilisation nuclease domain-containing protein n=1 Tax=Salipiger marinus TaxID=555512 RepID=A0A1G8U7I7_9RHOB|nr:relaxase/mobilization nuclease domain-containing protein [Salipiger marinus]SDJ49776.1 Relaxase/Mobilisation nuclease domain-containing protein [Salipiger marinus]